MILTMNDFSWQSFLDKFSQLLIESDEGYCKYPGATEEEIAAAEARLGTQLPPSYKSFLRVSNGWSAMGSTMPGELWSTGETEWLRWCYPESIEIWGNEEISREEHLETQGSPGDRYNGKYMENCLAISGWGDACIVFMCPEIVTPKGEWELWKLASWIPGVDRWSSFQNWMIDSYQFLIDNRQ